VSTALEVGLDMLANCGGSGLEPFGRGMRLLRRSCRYSAFQELSARITRGVEECGMFGMCRKGC
jgi:hypothetical protein